MEDQSDLLVRLARAELEAQTAKAFAQKAQRALADLKRGFVGENGVEVNYPVIRGNDLPPQSNGAESQRELVQIFMIERGALSPFYVFR